MTIGQLDATVTIDGNSMAGKIVSIARAVELCRPGQTADLTLAPGTDHASMLPWQPVVITEQGVLVLTGYVEEVIVDRAPPKVVVKVRDKYKRALDYFLDQDYVDPVDGTIVPSGQTIGWWIDTLCTLVGLSYSLPADSANNLIVVGDELPMSMMLVADAFLSLAAYAQWQIRVSPAGVVEFLNLIVPTNIDYDFTSTMMSGHHEKTDEETRTVAKIWGWNEELGSTLSYVQRLPVAGSLPTDRIMVFASPAIDTIAKAQTLANAALSQFASLEELPTIEVIGNANVQVGQGGFADLGAPGSKRVQYITNLGTTFDDKGYAMDVAMGRRCPRLPGFGSTDQFVVIVDILAGVWLAEKFYETSPHWIDLNAGTLDANPIKRIAHDPTRLGRAYGVSSTYFYRHNNLFDPAEVWQALFMPQFGGTFQSVGCDPVTSGRVVFTESPSGGGTKVYLSNDAGETIIGGAAYGGTIPGSLTFGSDGVLIMSIVSTILAKGQLYRSIDGGLSFVSRYSTSIASPFFGFPMACCRGRFTDTLFAWLHDADLNPSPGDVVREAVYSLDGGLNWSVVAIGQNIKLFGGGSRAAGLAADGLSMLSGFNTSGKQRSLNGGISWSTAGLGTTPGITNMYCAYSYPLDKNRWILAGRGVTAGIFYTSDFGVTFVDKTGDLASQIVPTFTRMSIWDIQSFPI